MNGRLSIALAALALLTPGQARAEFVDYSYAFSVSPQVIRGSGGLYATPLGGPSGTDTAVLGSAAQGRGPGVAWRIDGTSPGYVNATADVTLSLTDHASGQSGQFDFGAHFQGFTGRSVSSPASISFSPTATQTLQLGDHLYHVIAFVPAEPSDLQNISGLAFDISVTPAGAVSAPEPSSLAMGAIAAVGLALTRRRRTRRG